MERRDVLPTTHFAYQATVIHLHVSHTLPSAFVTGQQSRIMQINFNTALIGLTIGELSICALWVLEVLCSLY